mmetsp:Transcript_10921/g.29024  ORF Transcript_10921/g.29024 Transcript_10921/m.29024 type:complete len:97 (+) Transcript_10921:1348-1638(+)
MRASRQPSQHLACLAKPHFRARRRMLQQHPCQQDMPRQGMFQQGMPQWHTSMEFRRARLCLLLFLRWMERQRCITFLSRCRDRVRLLLGCSLTWAL